MKKTALTITAAAIAFSTSAIAQTGNWIEIDTDDQTVEQFQMTVDQLEDMDLFTADGERIGEIEEVLGTQDGQPTAFAAEVGGFLDIGDTDVIVPFDQVTMTDNQLQVDMTKEEVEALDRWED